jgi:zinc/manganese transport system ATP-binding protein
LAGELTAARDRAHPERREVRPRAVAADPVLRIRGGSLAFGQRYLWRDLDLDVRPGEFIAVLGANGSGKTSLLRVILGEQELVSGSAEILGQPVRRGSDRVGYIPQRVVVDAVSMVRARDLVRMGLDGHRWGLPLHGKAVRARIDALLRAVGATAFADAPVSLLSGGELQRVRIAEALASDPAILLCDEPLAALDLAHQQSVVSVLDAQRRATGTAVLFVTHDVNAVLDYVDKVLYLAGGRFRLGTPDEVLTSAALTDLYGADVDVFHAQGRVIVVAASDPGAGLHHSVDDHGASRHVADSLQ